MIKKEPKIRRKKYVERRKGIFKKGRKEVIKKEQKIRKEIYTMEKGTEREKKKKENID